MEDSQWTRNVELYPERRVLNDRGKSSKHVRTPPRWSITFIVLVVFIFFHMAWKMTGLDFAFNILRCIWENLILHSQQTNKFVLEMLIFPALYSKLYHFFRNVSCSKMSQRKWFRLCTKIKYHAPENTPKILIWPILHGRCFPAKPAAFHRALPAEPYNPQHQNVGPTSFSQPSLLLSACWIRAGGFVGHVSWRANAPFKSVSSALHSFEQSDGETSRGSKVCRQNVGHLWCCDTVAFH